MGVFLLDSSVILRIARADDDAVGQRVLALMSAEPPNVVATSAMNLVEVLAHVRVKDERLRERVLTLADALTVLPITAKTALTAAALREEVRRTGFDGLSADVVVLASAREHGARLVTDDKALRGVAGTLGIDACAPDEV